MRGRLVALTAVAVLAVVAAACGVDESSDFRPISDADVADLQATTSTTTTSTTTTIATTTLPETTITVLDTTTTVTPTQEIALYYISDGVLQPVPFPIAGDATAKRVLEALVTGLDTLGPLATGLRSAIPPGSTFSVSTTGGVAYVEMTSASLTTVADDNRYEFGQIVLTLLNNVAGIGQVKFSVDGAAITIERGDGSQIDAGGTASRDDYTQLVAA